MSHYYNPIVRNFCTLRASLEECLPLSRREVHPRTLIQDIVPADKRREVWQRLRQRGLPVPALTRSGRVTALAIIGVLVLALPSALTLRNWFVLIILLQLALKAIWLARPWAVHIPFGIQTLGELALYATPFKEHKHSGYRWTRNEISFRVRLIVAEAMGLPLDHVQP